VNSGGIDSAGAVRAGEELDVSAADVWLKARLPGLRGTPKVTQYAGGASNWTYLLEYENDALVLRRPPAGTKAKSAHDVEREYRLQRALRPVFPHVPEMRAYCDDASVIGAEFYVMERLRGVIPRRSLPGAAGLSRDAVRRLCTNVLDVLVALHRVDHVAAGLEHLGAGAGFVRRQVEGWSRRYRDARTWNVPRGEAIMEWLAGHLPREETICVTHNDFRFDNVVLDPADLSRVVGVLDWELAALGDPLVDLGNLLAYWVQADDDLFARSIRRQPTHLPGMLTREEVVAYYCDRTGRDPAGFGFYEVFGLFRLSVIAQQIYFRYFRRQTRNPAFRHYWAAVTYLHRRCRRAMRAG
jgi:aminoglycoside phosphotransferase (APT) family kinase protein